MQGNPVSKNETKKLKLSYTYKKLIEQHTKNKAGLLWCTPFILTSKRQRQVALLELEPSCVEKTLYQITKMYTCWNKRIKKKKERERKERKTEDRKKMKKQKNKGRQCWGPGWWLRREPWPSYILCHVCCDPGTSFLRSCKGSENKMTFFIVFCLKWKCSRQTIHCVNIPENDVQVGIFHSIPWLF